MIGEARLTEPIDAAESDATPRLIIVGETLFLSDGADQHIVAFDLDHMEVAEEWELNVSPTSLAFVGIVSDDDHPEAGHAHDEEDEHMEEDEHGHEDEDEGRPWRRG